MPHLFAITYPDETLATRAAEEAGRCAGDLGIDPDAVSVVVCGHDGSCRLTTSRRPGATAQWSGFWSGLLGTVTGEEESAGIDPGFRAGMRARLRPGTSALLIALSGAARGRALDALSPYGGEVLSCEIRDDPGAPAAGEITRSG